MISIQKLFLRNMIATAFVSIGVLYFLWIQNEYASFIRDTGSMKEDFVVSQKERLKLEVQMVLEYVHYMRNQTEKRLKTNIRERVYEAFQIASNIYRENAGSRSGEDIRKMIKDALRPIRFNNGRGYFFAFDMDGVGELFSDRPEMEGKNMMSVQGANGEFVVKDMIDLLHDATEGFYRYAWSKPTEADQNFQKIAFVKYFEPYGWGIGTGDYIDDVEIQIQNEVLERISMLRFEEEGYFFGSVYGGDPLFTNGQISRGNQNLWDLTDPNGIKIIQAHNIAAKKPEGGFVNYSWQKLTSDGISPKLAYVKDIPEWKWIIGAGIYMDTIEADILLKEKKMYHDFVKKAVLSFAVLVVMISLVYLLTMYNTRKIQTGIKTFSAFFENASLKSVFIDPDQLKFEEFKDIAVSANQMLKIQIESIHALQQSEKRYEAITDSAQDAIFCKDSHRRYTFVNPAMARLFDCNISDLIGKVPDELFEPEFAKIVAMVDDRTFEGENVSEVRSILIRGKEYTFHTIQVPLEVSDGRVVSISGIVRDISEAKAANAALEEEKKFTEDALNALMDTFFVFNPVTGKTLRWNRAFNLISGYSDAEIQTQKAPDSYYSKADLEKASLFIEKVMKNESTGTLELSLITKSGQAIPTEYTASVVKDSKGMITHVIAVGRDITERKKSEKEKLVAEYRSIEQEKHALVGQIAGKISHDFNNILGVIMGNTELALTDCSQPGIRQILELIYGQTHRGRNLTRNLIAFAKDQEPKYEFININEKMDLVISLLKKELAEIRLVKEYQEDLPETMADPGMMEHAMVNLLQNSIHALSTTKYPLITIRTYCSGKQVYLEMEDNGCGIPKEHLEGIFEPSFTLKGSRDVYGSYARRIKGTGYGLSNVKKYIEQHMGKISVSSEFGSGTLFTIHLPVVEKELTADEKTSVQASGPQVEKYILLVEDEPAIFDVQYRILTQEPCRHKVDIAQNGQIALDLINRNSYDLISLDYVLPGDTSGMDIYQKIRQQSEDIPVLFISGNIEFIESIKAMKDKDPFLDHLSKPCMNKVYVDHINALLNKERVFY